MTYIRSTASLEVLNTAIKEIGTKLKKNTEEMETSILTQVCVFVADFISFTIDSKGERPKEGEIRSHFQNTMEVATSAKSTKGFNASILTFAIKCGTLIFLTDKTSFAVKWYHESKFLDEQPKDSKGNPVKKATREIVFRLNCVYPSENKGTSDKPVLVPNPDNYTFATRQAIDWAYSHFVSGHKRDDFGRPQAGKKAAHNVPLDKASPAKVAERFSSMLNGMKKNETNKDTVMSVVNAAKDYLGEDLEEIEVTNKVVLIDSAGNLCSLTAVLNVVREEVAEKPLHLHDKADQELILSLFDLIKGMIEASPVKPAGTTPAEPERVAA